MDKIDLTKKRFNGLSLVDIAVAVVIAGLLMGLLEML